MDVIVTPEFNLTKLLMNGNAVVLSKAEDDIGPLQASVLAFGPRLLQEDPELGSRFMAAYLKGVQKYNEGKTERNLEIITKHTGIDRELLTEACWTPFHNDGYINVQSLVDFQIWAVEKGFLDQLAMGDEFWDPSFVKYANEVLERSAP